MNLKQLLPLADSPDFIHSVKNAIVTYHDEIRDMGRKPQFFTVCVNLVGEMSVVNRLMQSDTETLTRIFACKRIPDNQFTNGQLFSEAIDKNILRFLLYNSVMLCIAEPDTSLPLLINSENCDISALVKSRLNMPALWGKLRPLCLYHDRHPVCKLGYAGKAVEMYLAPISLMNFILGLDSYRKPNNYLYPYDGLTPHIANGFYTGFYLQ